MHEPPAESSRNIKDRNTDIPIVAIRFQRHNEYIFCYCYREVRYTGDGCVTCHVTIGVCYVLRVTIGVCYNVTNSSAFI